MSMERMLLTVRETADMLGISRSRVYELIWADWASPRIVEDFS